ncbi:hypothetical protein MKQ70_05610 [Chitinophaga sedimenti]|uniref:hypothetical protein n=1 Tax=Chitinophaga sedimenti TaxID=2033606 RepID=UPI002006BD0C|nr:hypothetical protein [Chitinophaga sedimenti]MCK7554508.1 hypothetical protein [Chitinophaga sedimenti]
MKKLGMLLLLSGATLFAACSRNDDNNAVNPGPVAASGTWRVTLFSERGGDETSDFSGYTFTFADGGTATAAKGGTSKTGSWSSSSKKFNIDFGVKSDANKPLGELTDDWLVISASSTEIKLRDDNSSSAEYLTFTKN